MCYVKVIASSIAHVALLNKMAGLLHTSFRSTGLQSSGLSCCIISSLV